MNVKPHRTRMTLLLAIAAMFACRTIAADEPTSHKFSADGVELRYLTAGNQGSTVVLLHGLYINSELNWRLPGTIKALAASHRVVALDFPGHGQSARPDDESAYGRQMSENVALLLNHLNVDKAHIVGYSMGGMVAMRFLADHPERCLSGVIAGMGWVQDGGSRQEYWQQLPECDSTGTPTTCTRGLAKLALTESELREITIPATVIIGERDALRQLYVEPLTAVRRDWPIVTIPEAGHLTCIIRKDFMDAVAKAVED
jgi:pimeloyl-ACP methyl ester carboxylesterase